ncbi:unnamed protein product [Allacma fusca]|uniref:Uncharacterized protein n=1 Tax=Allacma fusca TaxID=39272 RepID=A0A8J2NV44_9HEXA|nr:unnamed protein product [Allacma fusca]
MTIEQHYNPDQDKGDIMDYGIKLITRVQALSALQSLNTDYHTYSKYSEQPPNLSPVLPLEEIHPENCIGESSPPILSPAHPYNQEAEIQKSNRGENEREVVSLTGKKSSLTLKLRRVPRHLRQMESKRHTMMKPEIFVFKRDRREIELQISYQKLDKNLKKLEGCLSSIVSQEKTKLVTLQKQSWGTNEEIVMVGPNRNSKITSVLRAPLEFPEKSPMPDISCPFTPQFSILTSKEQSVEQRIVEASSVTESDSNLESESSVEASISDDNDRVSEGDTSQDDDILLLYDEDYDLFSDL